MKIQATPIPADEKLDMLKQDVGSALRGDNRTLASAIVKAIKTLERSEAEIAGRRHD
jgi:hypothetical protein